MLTFYTDKFIPDFAAACARGPVIFIRPKYKEDKGLLEHEKTHRMQWILTLGLHSLFYLFSNTYKLWSEVEAYKKQLQYYSDDRADLFAGFIATKYNLNISKENALKLLRS